MSTILMPAVLRKITQGIIRQAREHLLRDGALTPFAFVLNQNSGMIVPLMLDLSGPDTAARSTEAIASIARVLRADAVATLVEAWALPPSCPHDIDAVLREYGSISAYPQRMDVVALHVETADGAWEGRAQVAADPVTGRRTMAEIVLNPAEPASTDFARVLNRDSRTPLTSRPPC